MQNRSRGRGICKKKQTSGETAVETTRKYLRDNGLLAVPFDRWVGLCIMREQTYESVTVGHIRSFT